MHALVPRPHSQLRMDYITATLEVVWLTKLVLCTFLTVVGVNVSAALINGVIGQYVCKMNRCKLCDAPVLESRNRRQYASTYNIATLQSGFNGFSDRDNNKKGEYDSGYLCPRCFDLIKKYLALQDKLDSIRKDLKSKISSVCALNGIVCALNGIAKYLHNGETITMILPTRL